MKLTDEDRAACERVERLMRERRVFYVDRSPGIRGVEVAVNHSDVTTYHFGEGLAEALEACDAETGGEHG